MGKTVNVFEVKELVERGVVDTLEVSTGMFPVVGSDVCPLFSTVESGEVGILDTSIVVGSVLWVLEGGTVAILVGGIVSWEMVSVRVCPLREDVGVDAVSSVGALVWDAVLVPML